MYGDEFRHVAAKLAGVQHAYKTAMDADREFVRGRADPIINLSNQLAARAIKEASGEEEDDETR